MPENKDSQYKTQEVLVAADAGNLAAADAVKNIALNDGQPVSPFYPEYTKAPSYAFDTRTVHGENTLDKEHSFGAIPTPIYQAATFHHPAMGKSTGYSYSRVENPTRNELEAEICSLERCVYTAACSSGMSAIALMLELFDRGDHFVCTDDLYGGSVRIFQYAMKSRGMDFTYVDTSVPENVEKAITPATKALYIETPSNPTMKVTDLAKMHEIAAAYGLLLIVDNTFLSPYLQNPVDFGADLVIHSGTKYLAGHNDVVAGFVSTPRMDLAEKLAFFFKVDGYCLGPFDSYLTLRGIKTLALRMDRAQANALAIAKALRGNPKVTHVFYVGLPDDPGYEVNRRQARGSGAMLSFRTDTTETAVRVLNKVKLIRFAESLGGVESLITYPLTQTHAEVPAEQRNALGITETFLRMSVGIENADDLIADLTQAIG